MTEAEARKKWCPMARVFTGTANWVAAANRGLLDRDKGKEKCIGSECMMWRQEDDWAKYNGEGYCGLAGK